MVQKACKDAQHNDPAKSNIATNGDMTLSEMGTASLTGEFRRARSGQNAGITR